VLNEKENYNDPSIFFIFVVGLLIIVNHPISIGKAACLRAIYMITDHRSTKERKYYMSSLIW